MTGRLIILVIMVALCGCTSPPAGAPTDLGDGFRRDNHPAFTPKEKAIVSAVRRHLEQLRGKRIDAYYRVRQTDQGYSVLVFEVHRYAGKEPKFTLNRDWGVDVKEDGTIIEVRPSYE